MATRSARDPHSAASFRPDAQVPEGVQCRKCHYELRGLDPKGRCPECGLAIALTLPSASLQRASGDRWVPINEGLASLSHGIFWFAPFVVGCSLVGALSILTSIVVAAHGFWHFLAVRSIAQGLGELPDGNEDLLVRLTWARRTAAVHLGAAALGTTLVVEAWTLDALPGPDHLVGMAITLPSAVVAILASHLLAVELARETQLPRTPLVVITPLLLAMVGATLTVALGLLVGARVWADYSGRPVPGETSYLIAVNLLGPAWVAALALARILFQRVAVAVPQLATFNAAVRRIEDNERGPQPVSDPRSRRDLPPIPLADDPRR